MSNSANAAVIRELMHALETGDTANVGKYFADTWVNHDPSLPPMQGLEGARQLINLWSALSNRKVTIEDTVSEGDRVAMRFSLSGAHTGLTEIMLPASAQLISRDGSIFRTMATALRNICLYSLRCCVPTWKTLPYFFTASPIKRPSSRVSVSGFSQ